MGSTLGSRYMAATVWAILSATVGTPSIRTPVPDFFGISTALTGGGKYVPELIRFQSLYRLFFKSCSNSWRDCPSTPPAPSLALTLRYASHTTCLRSQMVSVLAWPAVPPALAVAHRPSPDGLFPSLDPHYRASSLLRNSPPLHAPLRYSSPRGFGRLEISLSRPAQPSASSFAVSGSQLPTFHVGA